MKENRIHYLKLTRKTVTVIKLTWILWEKGIQSTRAKKWVSKKEKEITHDYGILVLPSIKTLGMLHINIYEYINVTWY